MKKTIPGAFALLLLLCSACISPSAKITPDKPEDYLAFIDRQLKKISTADNALASSYSSHDPMFIQSTLANSRGMVDAAVMALDSIEGFRGDTAYKHAAREYLVYMQGLFHEEYKQIAEVLKKSNPTEEEKMRAFQVIDDVETKKADKEMGFLQAQQDFRKKFKSEK